MAEVVLALRRRARSRFRILALPAILGQVEQEAALAVPAVQAQEVLPALPMACWEIKMPEAIQDLLRPVILELVVLVAPPQDSVQMVHL